LLGQARFRGAFFCAMLGFTASSGLRTFLRATGSRSGLGPSFVSGFTSHVRGPSAISQWRAPVPNFLTTQPRAMSSTTTGPQSTEDSVVASVERKLTEALQPESLSVIPAYGDPNGSHVSISVVSDVFEGLNVVKRHKMVYKAIWEELQGPIHAVDQLSTHTPAEAGKA
jgi:stress-induced morphogen